MRRSAFVLALVAALLSAPCAHVGEARRQEALRRMRDVPPFWEPYLQAERPPLTPDAIRKGGLVLPNRYREYGLAVYDRAIDRWQAYGIPADVLLFVEHPHVWWLADQGDSRYWDLDTGDTAAFRNVPLDLFKATGFPLPDEAYRPLARALGGRIWSWRPELKTYQVFDPRHASWSDLPDAQALPSGLAVLGASDDGRDIRLVLGQPAYCIMAPDPLRRFVYDKRARRWSPETAITTQPTSDVRATEQTVSDGTYRWTWASSGEVLRYTPGREEPDKYRTLRGVQGQVFSFEVTPRAFWVGATGAGRYDRERREWTEWDYLPWRGAPRPARITGFAGTARSGEEALLLVSTGRPEWHSSNYAGIAHFDPDTYSITYYDAKQVIAGDWPHGPRVGPTIAPYHNATPKDIQGDRVRVAWENAMRRFAQSAPTPQKPAEVTVHGLTGSVRAEDEPWRFVAYYDPHSPERPGGGRGKDGATLMAAVHRETGQVVDLPYLDAEGFWIVEDYVYANIDHRFMRAPRAAFLASLQQPSPPVPTSPLPSGEVDSSPIGRGIG